MGNDERLIVVYPLFNETLRMIGAEGVVFGAGAFLAALLVVCLVRQAGGFTATISLITVVLIAGALVGFVRLMVWLGGAIDPLDG